MARPFHHPAASDLTLDAILHALADPIRRNIVAKLLSADGMNCSASCEDLPASTISHHYKVLREAGIIKSRKEGVSVINTVRKADLEKQFPKLLATIFKFHVNPRAPFKRRFLWSIPS